MKAIKNWRSNAHLYTPLDDFFDEVFKSSDSPNDTIDTDTGFAIQLAAPGYAKEDFIIRIVNNVISITTRDTDEKRPHYVKELFWQKTLPRGVVIDKISSSYKAGVLRIDVPISEKASDEKIIVVT